MSDYTARYGQRLTRRQHEALAALSEGLTNREIAERMFIEPRSVRNILTQCYVKLGVRNRVEAALAYQRMTREEAA